MMFAIGSRCRPFAVFVGDVMVDVAGGVVVVVVVVCHKGVVASL